MISSLGSSTGSTLTATNGTSFSTRDAVGGASVVSTVDIVAVAVCRAAFELGVTRLTSVRADKLHFSAFCTTGGTILGAAGISGPSDNGCSKFIVVKLYAVQGSRIYERVTALKEIEITTTTTGFGSWHLQENEQIYIEK